MNSKSIRKEWPNVVSESYNLIESMYMSGVSIFVKGYLSYHWSIVFWNCSEGVVFLVLFLLIIYFAVKPQYFRERYIFNTKPRLYYIIFKSSWDNNFDLEDSNS